MQENSPCGQQNGRNALIGISWQTFFVEVAEMLSRIQTSPQSIEDCSETVDPDISTGAGVSSGAASKSRKKLVNFGPVSDTAANINVGSKRCAPTHSQDSKRRNLTEKGTEGRVLVQLTQPIQPRPPVYEARSPEDASVMLLKAPVVWSPCVVKAAVSRLSGIQPTQPTQLNPPGSEAIPPANDSVMLLKATVEWSPSTVQAAVSRLSEVQPTQPTQRNPPVLEAFPPEDGSVVLPKSTVAWSPCTVKAAVSRLTGVQHTQATQPSQPAPEVKDAGQIKVVQIGCHRSRVLQGPWKRVGAIFLRGRFTRLPKVMMGVPGLKDAMVSEVLKLMNREFKTLTSLTFNSTLRLNNPVALKDFSWVNVMDEWKTTAPIFLKFLQHASKVFEKPTANQTPTPQAKSLTMGMGGALLLRSRSACMCAPMYINSMILLKGGAKKRCIEKLNRFGICMSNRRALHRLRGIGKTRDRKLVQWKKRVRQRGTVKHEPSKENGDMTQEGVNSDVPHV